MIPVEYITEKEIGARFDALPSKLQGALNSEQNLNVVNDICARNYITDKEKVLMFQQIVSLVMLGFIHYYDAGSEIGDALLINDPRFSTAMTDELTAKIFAPLKTELESVYRPIEIPAWDLDVPEKNTTSKTEGVAAPKILASKESASTATPAPAPSMPPATVPKPLPEKGWSTMKPSSVPPVPPAPSNVEGPKPFSQTPIKTSSGVPMPNATQPGTPVVPKPAMIVQSNDVPRPIKNAPDLNATGRNVGNVMPGGVSAPMPVRPIVLEMSKPTATQAPMPQIKNQSSEAAKVVHYSDLKSPLPAQISLADKPPVAEKGRQIIEMTIGGTGAQASQPIQNPSLNSAVVKPGAMPVPKPPMMPKPTPAAMPPKPIEPMPVPKPPKPMNQQAPMAIPPKTVAQPISAKPMVVDFKEGG